jgi:hypothetical protein
MSSITTTTSLDRKAFGQRVLGEIAAVCVLCPTSIAHADVSDGTSLPKGAQQFQKVLRIRNDIPVSG